MQLTGSFFSFFPMHHLNGTPCNNTRNNTTLAYVINSHKAHELLHNALLDLIANTEERSLPKSFLNIRRIDC